MPSRAYRSVPCVLLAAALIAVGVACRRPPAGDPLVVKLADGTVQGDLVGGARRFLKIPYAKPPVGDLRWKAPVKNDPWTDVRHETAFAEGCPQNASSQGPASANEDCLYANVWAPSPAPTRAPVMIWIHGGGNVNGSAGDKVPTTDQLWYDGQNFAAKRGVVLVSFNYRLGAMGFFAHPALAAEGSPLGNQGLLDQRLLFRWVRDNIAKFGGDARNVTIFGESAGSADVCYHIASPGSRGLFHRGISESGGCTSRDGLQRTAQAAAPAMEAFATRVGCDASAGDVLACLRGKPIAEVMANASAPPPTGGGVPGAAAIGFGAVIDGPGGVLPDLPRNLFDRGEVAKVPYILGTNNDEGTLFDIGASVPDDAAYRAQLTSRFGDSAEQVYALYPPEKFGGDLKAALDAVVSDSFMICGTHDTGRRARKAGLPVYMYNFNIPWFVAGGALKATHASEISHVFGSPVNADDAGRAVADAMNTYWATFAARGNPNYRGAPVTWPAFAPDAQDNDQRINFANPVSVVDNFHKAECAFWRDQTF
jgi:para-nitrobenzyl esterase